MTDRSTSCLMGIPGGPMKAPGGGGAGGPGLLGPGAGGLVGLVGLVGLGGPTGFLVGLGFGLEVVVVGHLLQNHRFLHRFLHSLIVPGLQVTVGSFLQEVRYFFHSHFLTFFQQLLLLGGLENS